MFLFIPQLCQSLVFSLNLLPVNLSTEDVPFDYEKTFMVDDDACENVYDNFDIFDSDLASLMNKDTFEDTVEFVQFPQPSTSHYLSHLSDHPYELFDTLPVSAAEPISRFRPKAGYVA